MSDTSQRREATSTVPIPVPALARRRGAYGVDAPFVPVFLGAIGVAAVVAAGVTVGLFHAVINGVIWLAYGLFFLLSMASYLYTTRRGKFQIWAGQLARLGLRGDERVVDLGCGRGAVLLMAAQLLPNGKAVGVDKWQSSDQSGNDPEVTLRNAERDGVRERVEVRAGDMRELPLPDAEFDVVLSSLAIHNIADAAGRARAIDETVRVLKPGGRLLIADFRATAHYAERLRERGMRDVRQRRLDWRFWYGGPWGATTLVSAKKPS